MTNIAYKLLTGEHCHFYRINNNFDAPFFEVDLQLSCTFRMGDWTSKEFYKTKFYWVPVHLALVNGDEFCV